MDDLDTRTCSECPASLAGRDPRSKTCSQLCRCRRRRRLAPETDTRYRQRNPDAVRKSAHLWRKRNAEAYRMAQRVVMSRRRARKLGAGVYLVTKRDLARLLHRQRGCCAHCSADIRDSGSRHLDHIIPLARGGRHAIGNLQWLCVVHNLAKGARLEVEVRHRRT